MKIIINTVGEFMANYYNEINKMIEKTIYKLLIVEKEGLTNGRKKIDLGLLDIIVLKKIGDEESIKQFSIIRETDISRNKITPIIKKLVSKGYVAKDKSKIDKRVNMLTITDKGKKVREDMIGIQKEIMDYILHDITLNEEKAILKFLAKASQRININY